MVVDDGDDPNDIVNEPEGSKSKDTSEAPDHIVPSNRRIATIDDVYVAIQPTMVDEAVNIENN